MVRWFLLSPYFKWGFQLMVGIWPISMIIFIRRISWPRVCLSATLYVVNMLMISQDATRGGRLSGAVILLGPAWIAITFAGTLVRCTPHGVARHSERTLSARRRCTAQLRRCPWAMGTSCNHTLLASWRDEATLSVKRTRCVTNCIKCFEPARVASRLECNSAVALHVIRGSVCLAADAHARREVWERPRRLCNRPGRVCDNAAGGGACRAGAHIQGCAMIKVFKISN